MEIIYGLIFFTIYIVAIVAKSEREAFLEGLEQRRVNLLDVFIKWLEGNEVKVNVEFKHKSIEAMFNSKLATLKGYIGIIDALKKKVAELQIAADSGHKSTEQLQLKVDQLKADKATIESLLTPVQKWLRERCEIGGTSEDNAPLVKGNKYILIEDGVGCKKGDIVVFHHGAIAECATIRDEKGKCIGSVLKSKLRSFTRTEFTTLWLDYLTHYGDNDKGMDKTAFARQIHAQGITSRKVSVKGKKVTMYEGVRLKGEGEN